MFGFSFRLDCEIQSQSNANRKLTRDGQLEGGSLHDIGVLVPFAKRQDGALMECAVFPGVMGSRKRGCGRWVFRNLFYDYVAMSRMKTTEINSCSASEENTSHSFSADSIIAPSAQPGHCYCPPGQEQGHGCAETPLVSITKCDSAQSHQGLTGSVIPQVNADTGEVILYRLVGEGVYREQKTHSDSQLEKWELLDSVQQFLEGHRTRSCMRFPRWKANVEILQHKQNFTMPG